jgi:hypothetical protein
VDDWAVSVARVPVAYMRVRAVGVSGVLVRGVRMLGFPGVRVVRFRGHMNLPVQQGDESGEAMPNVASSTAQRLRLQYGKWQRSIIPGPRDAKTTTEPGAARAA